MTEKEFDLSDNLEEVEDRKGFEYSVLPLEAVQEFIRLRNALDKEWMRKLTWKEYIKKRDKLAGIKLTGGKEDGN